MTVPTPLIWSTRTAIARCPMGTWTLMMVPVCPPFRVVAVIWAPVATGWRAICPTTCDGSVKAPALIEVSGRVLVVNCSALIRDESGMSAAATTTGPSVGGGALAVVARSPDEQQDAHEGYDRQEDPDE